MERKSGISSVYDEEFQNLELNLLTATFDGFFWNLSFTNNIDDTFVGDGGHIFNHFLWHILPLESYGLDSCISFSKNDKTVVSFGSDVVDSGSD